MSEIASVIGQEATPFEIQSAFEKNEFRASLPRLTSWQAPKFTGKVFRVSSYADQLSTKWISWLESVCLSVIAPDGGATHLNKMRDILQSHGYPVHLEHRPVVKTQHLLICLEDYFTKALYREQQFGHFLYIPQERCQQSEKLIRKSKKLLAEFGEPQLKVYLKAKRPFLDMERVQLIYYLAGHYGIWPRERQYI